MTVVIVGTFILCGLPYHVLETILSFGNLDVITPAVVSVAGAMAVANSAVNPFVFLFFNGGCERCFGRSSSSNNTKKKNANRRSDQMIEMRSSGVCQSTTLPVTSATASKQTTARGKGKGENGGS